MQTGIKALLGDPALTAMGLVPARFAPKDAAVPSSPSWRAAWLALGIGIALVIWLFGDTALHIVTTWYSSATFNHGFLILPICFYLIWLKRDALAQCVPRPFPLAAFWILGGGLGWLAGEIGGVAVVQQIALVTIIQGLFVTILGLRVSRLLFFPLAYLFFAAPFGEALIPPLQDLTANFVVMLLRVLHIPVFHDGIFISIPTGNFLVAEACSGVRFLIATLALGFLFAHLTYRGWRRKAVFMALSVVVPVFANGLRAFGLVYIAHVSDGRIAVGVDHVLYGWMFFAIVTVILLGIGMTFRDHDDTERGPSPDGVEGATPAASRHVVLSALLAFLAAGAGPAYATVIDARPVPSVAVTLTTPKPGGGWRLAGLSSDRWSPNYPGAHARLSRTFVKDGREVRLFLGYYSHQRHGIEMVGQGNSISGRNGWGWASGGFAEVRHAGRALVVQRVHLVRPNRGRIAYQWYWIAGRLTSNVYLAKFLQAWQVLIGASEAAATVIVSSIYGEHPGEADPALRDFVASLPPLQDWLGAVSRGRQVDG